MLPIFMPFTFMSESTANWIHTVLGPILLYQPGGLPVPPEIGALADKGLIQIHNPVETTEDDILFSLKRDYHAWAELRSNGFSIESGAFGVDPAQVPFWDKNSFAQIRTELNKFRQGESAKAEKNPILTARLFLALAQEHDVQNVNLAEELETVAVMEKRLMENLKAEEPSELDSAQIQRSVKDDMGSYMTGKRIEAWSTLFLADASTADFFVTSSRAVIEHLCDTSEDLLRFGGPDRLDKADEHFCGEDHHPEALRDYIKKITQSADPMALPKQKIPPVGGMNESLRQRCNCSIYLAPGISPTAFWQRYGECGDAKNKSKGDGSDILNTLMFYFEVDSSYDL